MEPLPKIVPLEYGGVLVEPWTARKMVKLLAVFGPAAIVASVAIGAGETIVVVRAGSWAGYDLMWLVLLSVLVKGVFVTYLLGRYTAVSGEPISHRLARAPGPRGWLLLLIVFLEMAAAGPLWAAVARPCGDLLYFLLFENSSAAPGHELHVERWITTLFILAALGFSFALNYSRLERQQVVICCLLVVGTLIGTVLVRPDLLAALKGSLYFGHLPTFPEWAPAEVRQQPSLALVTTFGYVGGSVLGYIVYANWIGLHGWGLTGHPQIDEIRRRAAAGVPGDYLPTEPDQVNRIRRSLLPLKWDVGCGALVLWIVSASFMMAGAAVLYPLLASGKLSSAFSDWSLLTDQAQVWRNIHPALVWVYYVCVLIALWGTLQAFPELFARDPRFLPSDLARQSLDLSPGTSGGHCLCLYRCIAGCVEQSEVRHDHPYRRVLDHQPRRSDFDRRGVVSQLSTSVGLPYPLVDAGGRSSFRRDFASGRCRERGGIVGGSVEDDGMNRWNAMTVTMVATH